MAFNYQEQVVGFPSNVSGSLHCPQEYISQGYCSFPLLSKFVVGSGDKLNHGKRFGMGNHLSFLCFLVCMIFKSTCHDINSCFLFTFLFCFLRKNSVIQILHNFQIYCFCNNFLLNPRRPHVVSCLWGFHVLILFSFFRNIAAQFKALYDVWNRSVATEVKIFCLVVGQRRLILLIRSKEQKTVCLLSSHNLLSNFGLGCFKYSEE